MKLPLELFTLNVCPGARLVLLALYIELEGDRAGELEAHLSGGPAPFVVAPVDKLAEATDYSRANVAAHLATLAKLGEIRRSMVVRDRRAVPGWLLTPTWIARRAA